MGLFDFLRDDDQDRFAARVMSRLRQRGWPNQMSYDSASFAIDVGPPGGQFYLGNVFRDWLKAPRSERRAQLDRAIAFIFESGADDSWEAVQERLLPIIRPRAAFENLGLSRERDWTAGPEQPLKVVAGQLCAMVAIDRASSIATVGANLLDEWGLSFEEAFEVAVDNLRPLSPCRFKRQHGGYYLSDFGDRYDVSRMLLRSLFSQLDLRGDPVAIAVVREGLVVAGSEDVPALKAMADFAEKTFSDATRPISCAPLVLRNGSWEPFEPEQSALADLRGLAVKQRVQDYAGQAHYLEQHFADLGLDRYVAPLEGIADGDQWRTWTSWAQEARPVLPKADALVLIDAQGRVLPRLWDDVEEVCGVLSREGATYPPRYSGLQWPSDDAWRRLSDRPPPAWLPDVSDGAS